ncbi:YqgE/AlgH family protein [Acinetobacter baumannii]
MRENRLGDQTIYDSPLSDCPPEMADDFFANTVIYLARHDEEGAQGIIINRPAGIQIKEATQ